MKKYICLFLTIFLVAAPILFFSQSVYAHHNCIAAYCGDGTCDNDPDPLLVDCTGFCSDGAGCDCDTECVSGDCTGGICIAAVAGSSITIDNPLNATSVEALIGNVINFIFWIAIAVAPIMFLIAGFYFITAGGDPKRVGTAKTIMIYTAIGLAIVLFAKGFVAVLKSILGG